MEFDAQCDALLRARDEDRWLSARYAPLAARRKLVALYAIHAEIIRVPLQVSEAPLGEIRFQWWRDRLGEIADGKPPRANPALEAVAAAGLDKSAQRAIETAIDAESRRLYGEPFRSSDEFAVWCAATEGFLAPIAIALLGGASDSAIRGALELAIAYAMARRGPVFAPHLKAGIAAEAGRRRARGLAEFRPAAAAIMPGLAHFALTPDYIDEKPPGPLCKRAVIFRAVATGRP